MTEIIEQNNNSIIILQTSDSISVVTGPSEIVINSTGDSITQNAIWGYISGNILNQTDLINYIATHSIDNISGLIVAGTNITITGSGTSLSPYVINSSGGGGGGVTAVTATAPLFSSGGDTPNISETQSGESSNGWLSSTDWNTFNNKINGISIGDSVEGSTPYANLYVDGSGNLANSFLLFDSGGTQRVDLNNSQLTVGPTISLDWFNGLLYDASQNLSVYWVIRQLYDSSVTPSLNWNSRQQYDSINTLSIDWGQRSLWSFDGTAKVLDWDNCQLFDNNGTGVEAMDWFQRRLYDSNGNETIDFTNLQLFNPSAVGGSKVVIDWGALILYNNNFFARVDWGNDFLYDNMNFLSLDWNGRFLYANDGSTQTIDWQNLIFRDYANFEVMNASPGNRELFDDLGNNAIRFEDGSRLLFYDGGNVPSVDYGNGELFDDNGTSSIDWQNRQARDSSDSNSIDWGNRYLENSSVQVTVDWQNEELIHAGQNSVQWGNRYLTNSSGTNVVEWDSQLLLDNSGNNSIDWQNRLLLYNDGSTTSVDWQNSYIYDSSSVQSVFWQNRYLFDNSGNWSIWWGLRILFDSTETESGNWDSRILQDTFTNTSLDWANRYLYDDTGTVVSINYQSRNLFDSSAMIAVDWYDRLLEDTNEVISVDWQGRSLKYGVGVTSVNWQSAFLQDGGGGNHVALDWGSRKLIDTGGLHASVDWGNYFLYQPGGTSVSLDWQNQLLIDGIKTSLDWHNRFLANGAPTTLLDWSGTALEFPNAGASSGYVWTATDSSGHGAWQISPASGIVASNDSLGVNGSLNTGLTFLTYSVPSDGVFIIGGYARITALGTGDQIYVYCSYTDAHGSGATQVFFPPGAGSGILSGLQEWPLTSFTIKAKGGTNIVLGVYSQGVPGTTWTYDVGGSIIKAV